MSNTEKKKTEDITILDNHSPAPPADGLLADAPANEAPVTTQDNHSPVPPKGKLIRPNDNHSPAPPKP